MTNLKSVTDVLESQEKLGQARSKAIDELNAIIADAERQLELLSSHGDRKKKPGHEPDGTNGKNNSKEKFCKTCQCAGHDLRLHAHRKHPEPFTQQELEQLH